MAGISQLTEYFVKRLNFFNFSTASVAELAKFQSNQHPAVQPSLPSQWDKILMCRCLKSTHLRSIQFRFPWRQTTAPLLSKAWVSLTKGPVEACFLFIRKGKDGRTHLVHSPVLYICKMCKFEKCSPASCKAAS